MTDLNGSSFAEDPMSYLSIPVRDPSTREKKD